MKSATEKMRKKVKKSTKFFRFVLVLWAFVMIMYVCVYEIEQIKVNGKKEEFEKTCLPYYVQKREVQRQVKQVDVDFQKERLPKAAVQVVFTELSPKVYELCYPILKEKELTGVLALSLEELPGEKGKMTKKQLRTLINLGWSTCVFCEDSSSFKTWWKTLKSKLEEKKLALPKTICFTDDAYDKTMDVMLAKLGFQVVMIKNQNKRIILQTQNEPGIWHIEGQGFMFNRPRDVFQAAIANCASFAVYINFTEEDELYNAESFLNFTNDLYEYSMRDKLIVGSPEEARKHFQKRVAQATISELNEYNNEKQLLIDEIVEIEQAIDVIVYEYYYAGE